MHFKLEVAPGEAALVKSVIASVSREVSRRDLPLPAETIAERLIEAFTKGERDFARLTALVLGAEYASRRTGPIN